MKTYHNDVLGEVTPQPIGELRDAKVKTFLAALGFGDGDWIIETGDYSIPVTNGQLNSQRLFTAREAVTG